MQDSNDMPISSHAGQQRQKSNMARV